MPPRSSPSARRVTSGSPFLTHVYLRMERTTPGLHPFDLPIVRDGFELSITTPVTILVGENGSGKSTLLEAIAWSAGFAAQGGDREQQFADDIESYSLGQALLLTWRQRVTEGFFLRAESFFNFASDVDAKADFFQYGGKSLHAQSHGEAFLSLFENRFEDGLFILDEPEAALSPQRQLTLLAILHDLTKSLNAQFIIATHSPILMAFPGATVLSIDDGVLTPTDYRDTEHFQLTRDFLAAPERYFRTLFADVADDGDEE